MSHGYDGKKFLCVAVLCAACLSAFAQDADDDAGQEMSQADLEKMARLLLGDEIRAGKLTPRQGADYVKCTQDAYAQDFYGSPTGKKYLEILSRLSEQNSPKGTASSRAELDRLQPELKKYQDRAEEVCAKKLGVSVPKGKVFGQP
ncbi:MAG: hypothetical protein LBD68_01665 [Zoogloeaceae bacterium]|jgi:hypothetical protein|nr:hypothetical protein [Zoogloeaceae bacterium]